MPTARFVPIVVFAMPVFEDPFRHSHFSLDVSGVVGFFGGEESFAAMTSVHLMRGRRWAGWYNSPGSLYIARKYGTIPESRFWDWLFPGPTENPAKTLELDSMKGPRYTGVYSGTQMAETGHLAHLLAYHCKERLTSAPLPGSTYADGHEDAHNMSITIVKLEDTMKPEVGPDGKTSYAFSEEYLSPFIWKAIIPVLFTAIGATLSALWGDWYCCGIIIFGALSNGISTYVLGSGVLRLIGPRSSINSPPGDGILFDASDVIVLQGSEKLVSRIIRGRYDLFYADSAPAYHKIGVGSLLLMLQFLAQLFLVPQGILIGQIMFLATLGVSWWFNAYVASFNIKALQADVLLKILGNPTMHKYSVDKWSTAAALATMYTRPKDPLTILGELVPNRTPAWDVWKAYVAGGILQNIPPSTYVPNASAPSTKNLETDDRALVEDFLVRADKASQIVSRLKEEHKPLHYGYQMMPSESSGWRTTSLLA